MVDLALVVCKPGGELPLLSQAQALWKQKPLEEVEVGDTIYIFLESLQVGDAGTPSVPVTVKSIDPEIGAGGVPTGDKEVYVELEDGTQGFSIPMREQDDWLVGQKVPNGSRVRGVDRGLDGNIEGFTPEDGYAIAWDNGSKDWLWDADFEVLEVPVSLPKELPPTNASTDLSLVKVAQTLQPYISYDFARSDVGEHQLLAKEKELEASGYEQIQTTMGVGIQRHEDEQWVANFQEAGWEDIQVLRWGGVLEFYGKRVERVELPNELPPTRSSRHTEEVVEGGASDNLPFGSFAKGFDVLKTESGTYVMSVVNGPFEIFRGPEASTIEEAKALGEQQMLEANPVLYRNVGLPYERKYELPENLPPTQESTDLSWTKRAQEELVWDSGPFLPDEAVEVSDELSKELDLPALGTGVVIARRPRYEFTEGAPDDQRAWLYSVRMDDDGEVLDLYAENLRRLRRRSPVRLPPELPPTQESTDLSLVKPRRHYIEQLDLSEEEEEALQREEDALKEITEQAARFRKGDKVVRSGDSETSLHRGQVLGSDFSSGELMVDWGKDTQGVPSIGRYTPEEADKELKKVATAPDVATEALSQIESYTALASFPYDALLRFGFELQHGWKGTLEEMLEDLAKMCPAKNEFDHMVALAEERAREELLTMFSWDRKGQEKSSQWLQKRYKEVVNA